ncbi:MAG: PilZ domain-containing protein [Candidatus Latescibacteria bacterium]|nr:PilZ domain-containing protein [Candidatus Latescibacterota bacterium]
MNIRKNIRVHLSCNLDVYDRVTGLNIGRIIDISGNGMMISGEDQINTNTSLYITMELPEKINGVEQLHPACLTHWWKKDTDSGMFFTGLTFKNLESRDKKIIDSLIKKYGIEE